MIYFIIRSSLKFYKMFLVQLHHIFAGYERYTSIINLLMCFSLFNFHVINNYYKAYLKFFTFLLVRNDNDLWNIARIFSFYLNSHTVISIFITFKLFPTIYNNESRQVLIVCMCKYYNSKLLHCFIAIINRHLSYNIKVNLTNCFD